MQKRKQCLVRELDKFCIHYKSGTIKLNSTFYVVLCYILYIDLQKLTAVVQVQKIMHWIFAHTFTIRIWPETVPLLTRNLNVCTR